MLQITLKVICRFYDVLLFYMLELSISEYSISALDGTQKFKMGQKKRKRKTVLIKERIKK